MTDYVKAGQYVTDSYALDDDQFEVVETILRIKGTAFTDETVLLVNSITITRTDNPQIIRIFEATSDGNKYSAIASPPKGTGFTLNNIIYPPDSGVIGARFPVLIARTATATDATGVATYTDIIGSSVSIADDTFVAGKSIVWKLTGTCTATNADKLVKLYIDNADIVTLTIVAANTADWEAEIRMVEYTDFAHQICSGRILQNGIAPIVDTAVLDTTDFASGDKTVKLRAYTNHASDHLIIKTCDVWFEQL
jgi:hypothetical protein